MKDAYYLFPDVTAALVDVHELAVKGKRSGLSADAQSDLLNAMRAKWNRAHRIAPDISVTLL